MKTTTILFLFRNNKKPYLKYQSEKKRKENELHFPALNEQSLQDAADKIFHVMIIAEITLRFQTQTPRKGRSTRIHHPPCIFYTAHPTSDHDLAE